VNAATAYAPPAPASRTLGPAAMSIDVEDWFHVENLKHAVSRASWETRELRVERNTELMLELLDRHRARATCFILGWVAERCPDLVRRIAAEGHEIACHGYGHELVTELTPDQFRDDVSRAKELLEDLTGAPVRGYRAPSFSITDWSIPILRELGFSYDSSVFPTIAHDRYGRLAAAEGRGPLAEVVPGFHEVSISCLMVGRRGLPWGGGGYFRLLPYGVFRRGIAHIRRAGDPYVFYIHPWEIDPGQPRISGLRRFHRFRHYVGLRRAADRFSTLLEDFRWTTLGELVATAGRAGG